MTKKKPGQLNAFLALAYYALKAQTRNPATFFFGFIFPVVFISIFGLIGNSSQRIKVGVISHVETLSPIKQAIETNKFLEVDRAPEHDLSDKLQKGKLVAVITLDHATVDPNGHPTSSSYFTDIGITRSNAYPQEAGALTAIISEIAYKYNLSVAMLKSPPVKVVNKEVQGRAARYIDFALPGQIGFSLLSTAIFGTVFGLIYLKKAGILKRMFATPTRALTILLAQGTSRLVVALLQTLLILLFGVFIFHFYLPYGLITFFELIILSTFGLTAFLGFGYLIAGLSNDENAASPLTNLVTLPQFLLSGTFFPTDNLPTWLQPIANNLPLSYFNVAVRKITTESGSLIEAWPSLLGLTIWGIVMYVIAARTFKWE